MFLTPMIPWLQHQFLSSCPPSEWRNGGFSKLNSFFYQKEKKMIKDQEAMEARLLTEPLLVNEAQKDEGHGDAEYSGTAVVILSTFVAVSASFCFGCATGFSSAAQSAIMKELGLSVAAYSVFGSIMTFGGMIGAIFSAKLADLIGRKQTMWFSAIFYIIGWLVMAFAKDAWWLDVGRFSLGIGGGLFSYVVPVYIAEIATKDIRGSCTFANQLMQNCGVSLVYIIGNFIHWRSLALISVIPCLVQVIGLFFIPESPRWLAKNGREKDFRAALQCLRGKNTDISQEAADIKDTVEACKQGHSNAGILGLFQKKYTHSLIVGVGLMLLQQLAGCSGISYYAGHILEKAHFPTKIGTTVLAIIMIPKVLMGLILVDKMGRRPLLMVSSCGMCLCSLLLGLSFCLQEFNILKELTPIFAFISLVGYIATFAMGMGGLPWIIMSEIFPMNVKVSAGSLVTLANWSTGWIVAYAFNFMLEWSSLGTFFIFSSISAGTVLFVWTLVPETKGRTLEEIQASFSNFLQ